MEKNNQTLEKGAYTGSSKNSLDASAERNKQIFIDEQQNIFKNIWVPVCHESELPEPYDFRTSSIGNDNIIVCRAPDGKINALLNVCPVQFRLDCSGEMLNLSRFQGLHIE